MVTDDCSQKCKCDRKTRSMKCKSLGCDDNSHCTVKEGENVCECDEGYKGDGFTCESECRVN